MQMNPEISNKNQYTPEIVREMSESLHSSSSSSLKPDNSAEVAACLANWQDNPGKVTPKHIRAIVQLANKGDERVIAAVAARWEDKNRDVREAAVRALPKLAYKGNEVAIVALSKLVIDRDENVRQEAVQALPWLVHRGDKHAIRVLCTSLEDDHWMVRRQAVQALAAVAQKGDEHVKKVMEARLEDDVSWVRNASRSALAELEDQDNERNIGHALLTRQGSMESRGSTLADRQELNDQLVKVAAVWTLTLAEKKQQSICSTFSSTIGGLLGGQCICQGRGYDPDAELELRPETVSETRDRELKFRSHPSQRSIPVFEDNGMNHCCK